METNRGGLIGALGFVVGVALTVYTGQLAFLSMVGASFTFALFSLVVAGRRKRADWVTVETSCLDSEVRQYVNAHGGGSSWYVRLLCTFKLNGQDFIVTPDYWTSFRSEKVANAFIEKVVSEDGSFKLLVNPKNPLHTELVGNDIKDRLLGTGLSEHAHAFSPARR